MDMKSINWNPLLQKNCISDNVKLTNKLKPIVNEKNTQQNTKISRSINR